MNMKKSIFSFGTLLLFSAILWSCSDNSDNNLEDDLTLVQLIEVKANALSDAVVNISESKGFEIITVEDDENLKTGDSRFQININLTDIKGVYDYVQGMNEEPASTKMSSQRRFNKVEDSDNFILRLPKEKAIKPWKLYENEDEEYVNDFIITTTEYEYKYSGGLQFDYLLNSEIEVEEEKVGELFVDWSTAGEIPLDYESKFTFVDDYSVGVEFQLGDKISYEFSLKKGDDILFQEEVEITSSGDDEGELEYSITLGSIKIVLNSESESYMVYRNGELQEGAVIQVINYRQNSNDAGIAFCRKGRDIKITFADGDSIELSEFITDGTLVLMDKIFSSMYDMKFVKHIVDKVAREVYYTNLNANGVD
tara:strand:- start:1162 stop:2262 length:1101 start_codon:yes stop_codon:yes gene_type:complete